MTNKKESIDEIPEEFWNELRELKDKGFAIVMFTPEELNGVSSKRLEDRLIELGNEVIEDLGYDEID
jgi:hypothetical protein